MDIVAAYACSHAGLIATRRQRADESTQASVFGAYDAIRAELDELRPDALLVIATDHMQAYPLPLVPQFTIGVGPTARGLGDGGIAPCTVPVHQGAAASILQYCTSHDVDLAFSEDVRIDHSFVMPLDLVTPRFDLPIVPIAQNCNVPPRPTFARSRQVGATIGAALAAAGPGRVAVLATGGLSHWVGDPKRRDFMKRQPGDRYADLAEHPVTLEDIGEVNEAFDRDFLDRTAAGALGDFAASWTPEKVEEVAGNGAQELRTWLTATALLNDPPADVLAYAPAREWLTGTAVVRFRL